MLKPGAIIDTKLDWKARLNEILKAYETSLLIWFIRFYTKVKRKFIFDHADKKWFYILL
jgi:hypothetical protein